MGSQMACSTVDAGEQGCSRSGGVRRGKGVTEGKYCRSAIDAPDTAPVFASIVWHGNYDR
jgi:hypothetical protein